MKTAQHSNRRRLILAAFFLTTSMGLSATAEEIVVSAPLLSTLFNRQGSSSEANILKSIGQHCQMAFNFQLSSFGQHISNYENNPKIDAVSTISQRLHPSGYQTDAYNFYQNGIIFDAERNNFRTLDDLAGKRVVSFVGGQMMQGVKDLVPQLRLYKEEANQRAHIQLLNARRIDAILGNGIITLENAHFLEEQNIIATGFSQRLRFVPVFPATSGHMYFKQANHRDAFNRCLADMDVKKVVEDYRQKYHDQYPNYFLEVRK